MEGFKLITDKVRCYKITEEYLILRKYDKNRSQKWKATIQNRITMDVIKTHSFKFC